MIYMQLNKILELILKRYFTEIKRKTKGKNPQLYNSDQILQNCESTGDREYGMTTKRGPHGYRAELQHTIDR